jgi:membrane dipeptidase
MTVPVFDLHCDTAYELTRYGWQLHDSPCHVSLQKAASLRPYAQVFALWAADEADPSAAFRHLRQYLARQIALDSGIRLCRTAAEIEAANGEGQCAALLSIEGAEVLDCDPGRLIEAWDLGVRMVSLTWDRENALAGSHLTGGGLTAKGREFVRRAQVLGMLVDVSHLSEEAFWQVCDLAQGPIVASHIGCRALWDRPRNLSDDQFRAICDLGGVAGIGFYTALLGEEPVTVKTVADHLCHWLDLGGAAHLALGGDLDGCDSLPAGVTGLDIYPRLYTALLDRGVDRETVCDIFYNNSMKVVKNSCSI